MAKKVKIVVMSDPHGCYGGLDIPKADIFICTGDFTISGNWIETNKFLQWVEYLPCKHKILVPGNHDLDMDANPGFYQRGLPKNTYMLINAGVNLMGLKFWGTPYTPEFNDWAFMLPRGRMHEIWDQVPQGIDFLLTHGPAYGILDKNYHGEHCGCKELAEVLPSLAPRYHIFGHIHHSYGALYDEITSINCSVLDDVYAVKFAPVTLEVTP